MLFPDLGSTYYDQINSPILKKMEEFYNNSTAVNMAFWNEAIIDTRFEAGDQTVFGEVYGNLPFTTARQFSFNRIKRIINMVSGHQRRNRKSIVATPVENGDQVTADQFTKILLWCNQQENILETVSEAFNGALVTGLNMLQIWIDFRSDPINGNIKVDNCDYNTFVIDPYFKKADLSDCRGIWKRSYLSKEDCISLWPDKKEEIEEIPMASTGTGRDGKFQYMPETYNYGTKDLLTYDEFYYRAYRKQRIIIDTETGETQEWRGKEDSSLDAFLQEYPQVKLIEQEIPTVKLAIVVQGKVMYNGANPLGIDQYPFVAVFGYFYPQMPELGQRIQGMVRGLRDSQFLYNRRRTIELAILESQVNSGWIYKEDALVDPKSVFLSGQGRGLALKKTAQMTDVMQIQAPQIPPSMIQLSDLLAREVMEISGVNEELLGINQNSISGYDTMIKQSASIVTLQKLFDQLDRSQRQLGKIMLQVIQTNFTPGKVNRILEDEPTREFYDKNFGRYDIMVEEGLNTTTQRQMQFAQMLDLVKVGVPISPDDLLEASTIQNKKKIIDNMMQQQQQQMQMQQVQMQSELQEAQARIKLAEARTKADTGLGLERISRIDENRSLAEERRAAAHKDDEQALLNFVKSLKEIENADLDYIQKLIDLSNMMNNKEEKTDIERNVNSNGNMMQNLSALNA